MKITWFESTNSIISFCVQGFLILALITLLMFAFCRVSRRRAPIILFSILIALVIFSFIFQFTYMFMASGIVVMLVSFFLFMSNIGDVRKFFANPFKKQTVSKEKTVVKITDKKSLFAEVQKTVIELSDKKIGALITFERNTNLSDICKNGVAVNAPFSKELISTIFYPGTRLHDGAVIIKDGIILNASVFYTPTTKPFATKYGSRHRAALGISEISDAVTIVVSEETGFVSIAYEGSIEHVDAERLANILPNYF